MTNTVHIISFDVPWPADYGGVIDVFYKLKALHRQGVKIILHCYEYGRARSKELEQYCEEVHYYPRTVRKRLLFNKLPFIVATRASNDLIERLLLDQYPILFEGLHCCYFLADERLKHRKKIVRMHNIEHHYYSALAKAEKKFFKRKYFEREAKKLKQFEQVLKHAVNIAAISSADTMELSARYDHVSNIAAFHPHEQVVISHKPGDYVLYHGSLSVSENDKAALFLVNEVFNDVDIPLIVAGNGASSELRKAIFNRSNISLKEDISTEQIYSLIHQAQINVLPTFQATGIKLKLLSALFTGRHCLVNPPMVAKTGLESLCYIANSVKEMKEKAKELMNSDFTSDEISKRKEVLERSFANEAMAAKLKELLF